MGTNVNMEKILLTTAAAAYLGMKPQTLRVWRLRGCGPKFVRLGASRFARAGYLETDLMEWMKARRFSSTAEETAVA